MKIKLDENLPTQLVGVLEGKGHDVDTVAQEQLKGSNNLLVWKAAQAAGRFFITQDLDFSDVRAFAPGTHEGLMLIRLRDPSRQASIARLTSLLEYRRYRELASVFSGSNKSSSQGTEALVRVNHAIKGSSQLYYGSSPRLR